MRAVLSTFGSDGDYRPMVALGAALQRAGVRVSMVANPHFASLIQGNGLELIPVGRASDFQQNQQVNRALGDPSQSSHLLRRILFLEFFDVFDALSQSVESSGEPTVLVGSPLALPIRCLGELTGLPSVVAHFSPFAFRSRLDPPQLSERSWPGWMPAWGISLAYWLIDKLLVDPLLTHSFNRARFQLGLPPVRRMLHRWLHEVDAVLGLFPDWFAPAPSDWPRRLVLSGFPLLTQEGESGALSPELEDFLRSGSDPIVITGGTPYGGKAEFYEVALAACRAAGRRSVLVSKYGENLPAAASDLICVESAPFDQLFARASAVVHHGGIGTTAQALAAGLPQVVCPTAFDQFDTAHRVERLGVARVARPMGGLPMALQEMLAGECALRARELAPWVPPGEQAMDVAANQVLNLLGSEFRVDRRVTGD